ncbi:alpha-ketoglutarate-dependent dioxygenase AlkB [Francisellaceae bacterium]|nr:alpha-ketoglutarate-dependent dioxygenase AlkB [Francisellaceae bacterium]
MDLFNQGNNKLPNLLPHDGTVHYYGDILGQRLANGFFQLLLNDISWENDKAIILGKEIITKRKVAWYADKPFQYTYSRTTKTALPWTNTLLELKSIVESVCNEQFNSCLLNLYHNGEEGMAWHSDAEKDLKKNGAIGSVSLGAARKFGFKHKHTKETVYKLLEPGSLLVMKDTTQSHWMHRLPPCKSVTSARINLTFRTIV